MSMEVCRWPRSSVRYHIYNSRTDTLIYIYQRLSYWPMPPVSYCRVRFVVVLPILYVMFANKFSDSNSSFSSTSSHMSKIAQFACKMWRVIRVWNRFWPLRWWSTNHWDAPSVWRIGWRTTCCLKAPLFMPLPLKELTLSQKQKIFFKHPTP
jgi:hypothetical protein